MASTTEAQKRIPLDQHKWSFESAPQGQVKALCSCGWKGGASQNLDGARGKFATHTSSVWRAQDGAIHRATP